MIRTCGTVSNLSAHPGRLFFRYQSRKKTHTSKMDSNRVASLHRSGWRRKHHCYFRRLIKELGSQKQSNVRQRRVSCLTQWFMKTRDDVKLLTVTLEIIKKPTQRAPVLSRGESEIRIRGGQKISSHLAKGPFSTASTREKTGTLSIFVEDEFQRDVKSAT